MNTQHSVLNTDPRNVIGENFSIFGNRLGTTAHLEETNKIFLPRKFQCHCNQSD